MKKTFAYFKQQIAEKYKVNRFAEVRPDLDKLYNEAAELHAEYKAKEAWNDGHTKGYSDGIKDKKDIDVELLQKESWNEALELAATICRDDEYGYNKHAILERLKP